MKRFELFLLFDNAQNTHAMENTTLHFSELSVHRSLTSALTRTCTNKKPTKAYFLPNIFETDCKALRENSGGNDSPLVCHEKYPFIHLQTHTHTRAHSGVYFLLGFIVLEPLTQAGVPVPVCARAGWLCQGAGCCQGRTQAVWGDVLFGTATAHTEEQSSDHLVHTQQKTGAQAPASKTHRAPEPGCEFPTDHSL